MKIKLRTPFFEIGVKNYIYGDAVLSLAKAADAASEKYDIDVMFITPYMEIRRITENTNSLIVMAPFMDTLRPGRGIADILPEAVKSAGAKGVIINHCERPLSLSAIRKTIERANELDLLSFVCADSTAEAQTVAHLHPDIINSEPSELIGTGAVSGMDYVTESIRLIKAIDPEILVEQAAGITNGRQVFDLIFAGAEGVGVSSGIVTAADPCRMADEMVQNVRLAYVALQKKIISGEKYYEGL